MSSCQGDRSDEHATRRACHCQARVTILALAWTAIAVAPVASQPVKSLAPTETLKLFGLDQSQLSVLADGRPIDVGEWEPIHRILYVLSRVDVATLHDWTQTAEQWQTLLSTPDEYRLQLFRVAGQLKGILRIKLPAEVARRFGFVEIYRLSIVSTVDGQPVELCVKTIPNNWNSLLSQQEEKKVDVPADLHIPVACNGAFLKLGQSRAGSTPLIFAAARAEWYPNQTSTRLTVGQGLAVLGAHGMNVGLFDDLIQRTKISASDRECFYQMLWTTRRIPPQPRIPTEPKFDFVKAIQSPEFMSGERYYLEGLARRAIKIRVEDPDIQQRYGIDHYYEVALFVPLKKSLRLVDAKNGHTQIYHNFPITVCCRSLPENMSTGDSVRQSVSVDGFFLKLRAYSSGEHASNSDQKQLSPVLISSSVKVRAPETEGSTLPAWLLAGVVFGGLFVVLVVRYSYGRGNRQFERWRQRSDSAPEFDQLTKPHSDDASPNS